MKKLVGLMLVASMLCGVSGVKAGLKDDIKKMAKELSNYCMKEKKLKIIDRTHKKVKGFISFQNDLIEKFNKKPSEIKEVKQSFIRSNNWKKVEEGKVGFGDVFMAETKSKYVGAISTKQSKNALVDFFIMIALRNTIPGEFDIHKTLDFIAAIKNVVVAKLNEHVFETATDISRRSQPTLKIKATFLERIRRAPGAAWGYTKEHPYKVGAAVAGVALAGAGAYYARKGRIMDKFWYKWGNYKLPVRRVETEAAAISDIKDKEAREHAIVDLGAFYSEPNVETILKEVHALD